MLVKKFFDAEHKTIWFPQRIKEVRDFITTLGTILRQNMRVKVITKDNTMESVLIIPGTENEVWNFALGFFS